MSKIQSHAECSHENSKSARAKCRRNRAKNADAIAAFEAELAVIGAAIAEPAVIETPAPVFEAITVTAENWREFAETRVRIFTRVDDETQSEIASGVTITGWGKRWINYRTADEQIKRAAADSTTGVETIEG
jgi:hypothetical protein